MILTDKATTYEMETIVRANAGGGGTEAFMDIYYWCLYPKLEKKEITLASYSYDDDGRYSFTRVYSLDGKFLRRTGEIERE